MRVPHRYYPPRIAAWRPDHHHQPLGEKAGSDIAGLAIILPVILHRRVAASKNGRGIREVQPAMSKGSFSLGWIEGDFHGFIVTTENGMGKAIIGCRHAAE
jgi:hypothetical protein